jgi:hypothetical protein
MSAVLTGGRTSATSVSPIAVTVTLAANRDRVPDNGETLRNRHVACSESRCTCAITSSERKTAIVSGKPMSSEDFAFRTLVARTA